ncbi:MAG TPA: hypothetical protein VJW75_04185, partial [Candidatus Eisenbacteria bacterium]|nr:hypothetical protein [Candidatus Eisenbacteria bacterium]
MGLAALLWLFPATATAQSITASQSPVTVRPAQASVNFFTVTITNNGLFSTRLTQLRLTNTTIGPGTLVQRDAEFARLRLYLDDGDGVFDAGDAPASGYATATSGKFTFSGLSVTINALGGSERLFAVGDVAPAAGFFTPAARDGDLLDLAIQSSSDVTFSSGSASNSFPLSPAGNFTVDGMVAAQISVSASADSVLAGVANQPVASVVVPANGYQADVLQELTLVNTGTAQAGSDIAALAVWVDDGDKAFNAALDRKAGSLVFTGSRWQLSGLSENVPVGGLRLFVTADVAEFASRGRTIRMSIPAAPTEGLTMLSANDGPLDVAVTSPSAPFISLADRITFNAVAEPSASVRPGQSGVLMLHLTATNTYGTEQTLGGLRVTNTSVGPGSQSEKDREFESLTLVADGDADGVLDGFAVDTVLGTAIFSNGRADFTGLGWSLPAGATRHLFLLASVSAVDAADGDTLAANVASSLDVAFKSSPHIVPTFPLDSGIRRVVDGMVAAQIRNIGASVATLAPNEGPVLALDVTLPSNGYQSDILRGLTVVNNGSAGTGDLAALGLWRDGGDGVFSQGGGDDAALGPLIFSGGAWTTALLSNSVPVGGARYFVGVTVSSSPSDSATVRLAIPVNGVAMQSGNDGPLDAAVVNPSRLVISNSPLNVTMKIETSSSTVGQQVRAVLIARNRGSLTLTGVTPTALAFTGSGSLNPVSGPTPPTLDLAPAAVDTFAWTFTASSPGDVAISAGAQGVEQPSGTVRVALEATSNTHQVLVPATSLDYTANPSMPPAVNRGETGVTPLSLTFTNSGGASTSPVRLLGLRIRLENEASVGIVPSSLLSRVEVAQGTTVRLSKAALETTGAEIDLPLTLPVTIPPGESAVLTIRVDIDGATTVPSFRVAINGASGFSAEDAIGGGPVTLALQGASYPIRTESARVVASPTRLDVASTAVGTSRVSQGQSGVTLATLRLDSPGLTGITSDVQVTSLQVALLDTTGLPVNLMAEHLDRIQFRTALQSLGERVVSPTDGAELTLVLNPPLRVPVNTPLDFFLTGDVAAEGLVGAVRLRLGPTSLFDAQDERTGSAVPVFYATDPLDGQTVVTEEAADSLLARGSPRFPPRLAIGSVDVPAIAAVLRHPDGPGHARVRVDTLVIQCRDEARQPLDPDTYLSRIRVRWNGTVVATQTDFTGMAAGAVVPLPGLTLEPSDTAAVEITVDIAAAAPTGFFEMLVFGSGIRARDANSMVAVNVEPEPGTELPIGSALTRLELPPRELLAGFESRMPAALAADGDTVVAGALTLTNSADAGSGSISVTFLRLDASDRSFAAIPVGAGAARLLAFVGGTLWAESAALTPDSTSATLVAGSSLDVP